VTKLYQSPFDHLMGSRYRGGIAPDDLRWPVIDGNAALIECLFNRMPIRGFTEMSEQMRSAVITKIQDADGLSGDPAQGLPHARHIGCHRHGAVVAFAEDRGQPDHRRPPPTYPLLFPMLGKVLVQNLG